MPMRLRRARSAGVLSPLSPTTMRSGGTRGASRSLIASVVSKRAQVAVVDADQARFQPQGALKFIFLMNFNKDVHPIENAAFSISCAAASSTAAMMIRMQSAPSARDSTT